jgi:hypothetical protein
MADFADLQLSKKLFHSLQAQKIDKIGMHSSDTCLV